MAYSVKHKDGTWTVNIDGQPDVTFGFNDLHVNVRNEAVKKQVSTVLQQMCNMAGLKPSETRRRIAERVAAWRMGEWEAGKNNGPTIDWSAFATALVAVGECADQDKATDHTIMLGAEKRAALLADPTFKRAYLMAQLAALPE